MRFPGIPSYPLFLLVLLLAFSAGCLTGSPVAPETPPVSSETISIPLACPSCNLIVISLDAVQARHLFPYGYPLHTAPNLEEFAQSSFLFSNAVSAAPWTVPSHMTWFTGVWPSVHQVVNKFSVFDANQQVISNLAKLSPGVVTLAQVLQSQGYRTAGFTGDAGVSAKFGYNLGFEVYEDSVQFGGMEHAEPLAEEWLDSLEKGKKFFLFLHGYDAHGQNALDEAPSRFLDFNYTGSFTGSPEEQGRLREEGLAEGKLDVSEADKKFWRAVYDQKIFDEDARLGQFLAFLEKKGLLENSIILVSSDHGTEFFEHGRMDHGHTLYQELLEVPFLLRVPNSVPRAIPDLVSSLDYLPTLLALLGVQDAKASSQAQGRSLVPLLADQNFPSVPVFAETDYRDYTHQRSVEMPDGWKYILTLESGKRELFNLALDRDERHNLAEAFPEKARELEALIGEHLLDMNSSQGPWDVGCLPVYNDQCLVPRASADPAPAVRDSNRPNIVIVSIDSLRTDRLGAYGSKKGLSPHIDALAQESLLFENAFVPGPFTFQNFASLLSGTPPSVNQVQVWYTRLSSEVPWLPEILQKQDYNTLAFVAPSLWPSFDFNRGFSKYLLQGSIKNAALDFPFIRQSILENAQQPFFLYWHIYDVHQPYAMGDGANGLSSSDYNGFFKGKRLVWDSRKTGALNFVLSGKYDDNQTSFPLSAQDKGYLELAYDSGVPVADSFVGKLVQELKDQGLWDSTLFLLTSDHGEDLGEHGLYFHSDLYNNNAQAPLLLHIPGKTPRRIPKPVSTLDVLPTLLELLSLPLLPKIEGVSLLPALQREKIHDRIFLERPPFQETAVIEGEWKFIQRNPEEISKWKSEAFPFFNLIAETDSHPERELFNLSLDPSEQNNLAEDPAHSTLVSRLEQQAQAYAKSHYGPLPSEDRIPVLQPYP